MTTIRSMADYIDGCIKLARTRRDACESDGTNEAHIRWTNAEVARLCHARTEHALMFDRMAADRVNNAGTRATWTS